MVWFMCLCGWFLVCVLFVCGVNGQFMSVDCYVSVSISEDFGLDVVSVLVLGFVLVQD